MKRLIIVLFGAGLACAGPASEGGPPVVDPPSVASPGVASPSTSSPAAAPIAASVALAPNVALPLGADGSLLPEKKDARHPLVYALDGDPRTAWVAPDGASAWLELASAATLTGWSIVPGYAKSDATWTENRRPTEVRWRTWSGGAASDWVTTPIPSPPVRDATPVAVAIDPPRTGVDVVEIAITAFAEGTQYRDLCVSEMALTGQGAPGDDAVAWETPKSRVRTELAATGAAGDADWIEVGRRSDGCAVRWGRGPDTIGLDSATCVTAGDGIDVRGGLGGGDFEAHWAFERRGACLGRLDGWPVSARGCGPAR